jgi:preprotein translocase subunit SecE
MLMLQKIKAFIQDVKQEMAKVSWPSWGQLKGQTMIVIFVSLFFAVFIFVIDHLLARLLSFIY